jgi:hypothetical protein
VTCIPATASRTALPPAVAPVNAGAKSTLFALLVQEYAGAPTASAADVAPSVLPARPRTAPANGNAKKDLAPRPATGQQLPLPAVLVMVTVPPAPPLLFALPTPMAERGGRGKTPAETLPPAEATPAEHAIHLDAALQLRLRRHDAVAPMPLIADLPPVEQVKPQPQLQVEKQGNKQDASPDNSAPDKTKRPVAANSPVEPHAAISDHPQTEHVSSTAISAAPSAPALTAPAPIVETANRVPSPPTRSPLPEPALDSTAHLREPLMEPKNTQPTLRSVSLEFTPDGAGDIRLRVSERAGEVHISLHTQDGALSGRLHEGVHELVGSLSRAGYEAEAWTAGHGQQNQQREQQDQEKRRRSAASSEAGGEEFNSIFQQPTQEIS